MARWVTEGKATFLIKDTDCLDDPLSYRVLLILAALYRAWARLRLHDMRPWIASWDVEGLYSGVRGNGAADAWMSRK